MRLELPLIALRTRHSKSGASFRLRFASAEEGNNTDSLCCLSEFQRTKAKDRKAN